MFVDIVVSFFAVLGLLACFAISAVVIMWYYVDWHDKRR